MRLIPFATEPSCELLKSQIISLLNSFFRFLKRVPAVRIPGLIVSFIVFFLCSSHIFYSDPLSRDGSVTVREIASDSGGILFTIRPHLSEVESVALRGCLLVSGSKDHTVSFNNIGKSSPTSTNLDSTNLINIFFVLKLVRQSSKNKN